MPVTAVSYTHLDVYKRQVLEVGAGSMQRASGVPVEIVLILEGLILLFLLMSDVIADRVRRSRTCLLYTSRCV